MIRYEIWVLVWVYAWVHVCVCVHAWVHVCVCVVCTETILNNNSEFYVVLCNKRASSMEYNR